MLAKPCTAWPCMSKNMVYGIGALSHSCEWWSASMRLGWKVPLGVSRPAIPVETGQTYMTWRSTVTVMVWVSLSTRITISAAAGRADTIAKAPAMSEAPSNTPERMASPDGMVRTTLSVPEEY